MEGQCSVDIDPSLVPKFTHSQMISDLKKGEIERNIVAGATSSLEKVSDWNPPLKILSGLFNHRSCMENSHWINCAMHASFCSSSVRHFAELKDRERYFCCFLNSFLHSRILFFCLLLLSLVYKTLLKYYYTIRVEWMCYYGRMIVVWALSG